MSLRTALCGVVVSATASIAAVACAHGEGSVDLGPVSVPDTDGGGASEGAARLPAGGGGGGGGQDASTPDAPTTGDCPSPSGCAGKVVINELMARGPGGAGEEFVELYNPNACAVPLSGWKLAYKSKTGTGNTVLHTFGAGNSISAGSFLLLGTSSFSGKKDAPMTSGMADEGQIGLLDDDGVVVDAVGYGATTGPYVEGSPAKAPPSGGSIGRTCGADTDNNSADFKTYTQHSAGVSNP